MCEFAAARCVFIMYICIEDMIFFVPLSLIENNVLLMHKLGYCKRFCSTNCDKCQGSYIKKTIRVMTCVHRASCPRCLISLPNFFIETKRMDKGTAPIIHKSGNVFHPKIQISIVPCTSGKTDAQWTRTVGWFDRTVQMELRCFRVS